MSVGVVIQVIQFYISLTDQRQQALETVFKIRLQRRLVCTLTSLRPQMSPRSNSSLVAVSRVIGKFSEVSSGQILTVAPLPRGNPDVCGKAHTIWLNCGGEEEMGRRCWSVERSFQARIQTSISIAAKLASVVS